jgi:para-nitrobenzyl esterase
MKHSVNFKVISLSYLIMLTMSCSAHQPAKAQENRVVITNEQTIAQTIYGKVQGYLDGDVFTFKGIPYAKADRFMPPQAPDKHNGILKCRLYGPKAPQGESLEWKGINQTDYAFGNQFVYEPMDEKGCLVLNVWTKGLSTSRKRPVFVWIHGGGYSSGSGHDLPCYEGKSLAEKGDIVTVTLNHRLNVLGYCDLTALGGKYSQSVNLGMQDIVKALEWVKDNIAYFGGDPNNVTIGGQSGGAGKVSTLLAMPSAHGLFQKAIIQSGSTLRQAESSASQKLGLALLDELGIRPSEAEKLNSIPYELLVKAGDRAIRKMATSATDRHLGFLPVVDGNILPRHPFSPDAPDISKDIPVIIGTDFNEFSFENTPLTLQQAKDLLQKQFGNRTDEFIQAFSRVYPHATPRDMTAIDLGFRPGAIKQADLKSAQQGAPVYLYLFNWRPKTNLLAASHGMELPFMFNNVSLQPEMTGNTADAHALEEIMSDAWLQFIKEGNPRTPRLRNWQPYTAANPVFMIFDDKCSIGHVDKNLRTLMSFGSPIF